MPLRKLPTRRRVYLMRHGEVTYFDRNGPILRSTEVPLNQEGCRQALAAAATLAEVAFDRVVTSGLVRTDETARLVLGGRGLEIERHPELHEITPGLASGISPAEVGDAIARGFSGPNDRDTRFLGGETYGDFLDRVLPCWSRLIDEPHWQTLLIVAHGGVNRAILAHVLGSGLAGFGALEQDPACINIIDVDGAGSGLVRLVNFTPYNPLKEGWHLTTMERLFVEYVQLWQSFENRS